MSWSSPSPHRINVSVRYGCVGVALILWLMRQLHKCKSDVTSNTVLLTITKKKKTLQILTSVLNEVSSPVLLQPTQSECIPSTCSRITSKVTSRTTYRVWSGAISHVRHLRADSVVWLSYMSSVWPRSGAPKVRLYDTLSVFWGHNNSSYSG